MEGSEAATALEDVKRDNKPNFMLLFLTRRLLHNFWDFRNCEKKTDFPFAFLADEKFRKVLSVRGERLFAARELKPIAFWNRNY